MPRHPFRLAAVMLLALSATADAEPFHLDPMPADLDGSVHPWSDARQPVAVDFNGDGRPSWYAGGNRVAHPKDPTPLDPARYTTMALPGISLPACPSCTPRNLAFAAADINRDGKPDIVRINGWNGHSHVYTLQVFHGDGANGFTPGWREDRNEVPDFASGERFFQLALADVDRDGDPDLVVLSTYLVANGNGSTYVEQGRLSWRENKNQAFVAETVVQSQHFGDEADLLVGDIDRDGDVDLIVDDHILYTPEDTFSYQSRIFAGDGAGGFSVSGVPWMKGVAHLADLNRDGWPDLLINEGYNNAHVGWRSNNHAGGFHGEAQLTDVYNSMPHPVTAVADVDEDGIPDLVTAQGSTYGSARMLVLRRGTGNGYVGDPEQLASFGADIVAIGPGDAAGDGDADLLVRLDDGSFVQLRNLAQRLDPRAYPGIHEHVIPGLSRLEAADANRDGIADLFALQPGGNKLHRLQGQGNGSFSAAEFKLLASGPRDFALADFNRDGRTDIAYTVPGSGAVRSVTQDDGIYFAWIDTKLADLPGAALVRAGDGGLLNGTTDLAVSSDADGSLRWLINPGSGTWNATTLAASRPVDASGLALLRGYGGFADALLACGADGVMLEVTGYSNLLGWYQSAALLQEDSIAEPRPCVAAQLDQDRVPELVLVDGIGRLVWWDPTPTLPSSTQVIDPGPVEAVRAIRVVDWDRDGRDDLLLATDAGLVLHARQGATDAWTRVVLASHPATGAQDVVAVDANRDSFPDAAYITGDEIRVVFNASSVIRGGGMGQANAPVITLQGGQTGIGHAVAVSNPGRLNEDAAVAVTGAQVSFRHAAPQGEAWYAAGAMTAAEVKQLVASVSLWMDGKLIGTAGSGAVTSDGRLAIDYSSLLGQVVPIQAGETRQLEFRVKLAAGAAQAGVETFFLSQRVDDPGKGRVLHDGQPTGRLGSFQVTGPALTRIVVAGAATTGELFASGFE